ncbi:MAG: ABC transporter permease [Candidatus Altiarchaeota archaeon]|nr:ABC transporter permease [Candidatus Altiarchaeota archaeon]
MKSIKVFSRGKIILYELDKAVPLLPVALLFVGWAAVAWFIKAFKGVDFPGPFDTVSYLYDMLNGKILFERTLYVHLYYSLKRFILGLTTASALGVSIGLLLGYFKALREHLYPRVSILQPIPSVAWIPVAILLFGIGDFSTIFIIFMASLWPTIVNTVAGSESVPENYLRMARMFRISGVRLFTQIVIPHSVPYILNGLRISVANAWRSLVAAEMIAATGTGLGYVIIQSRWNLDYTSAFACIMVIAIVGYVVEKIIFQRLEYMTLKKWGMLTS